MQIYSLCPRDQKSEMGIMALKLMYWQSCVSSTGESIPCLFQLLEVAGIPWLMVPNHSDL